MAGVWSMGPGTYEVPLSLFAKNRDRLAEKLKSGQVVVLQGGDDINLYDTDIQYVFRQEAYFTWACGVREPGCYFALDVKTKKSIVFVPRLPDEYEIWMGKLLSCQDYTNMYGVDEVRYVDEICDVLKSLEPDTLLTLVMDNETLFPIIAELRVIKTPEEIEVMRYICKVSSDAHKQESAPSNSEKMSTGFASEEKSPETLATTLDLWKWILPKRLHISKRRFLESAVMLYAKPGLLEYQCESVFLDHCYRVGGCRHVSYTCICGSGDNSAILHYGHAAAPNNKMLKDGDICLFDMGGNYAGYAADITCSFPANGKFTEDQKLIYEAVLAARDAVIRQGKPGVKWTDMHLAANRAMLEHLKRGGLLKGEVEKMIAFGVNGILQPHGLGHLLGLDVHDVGGYLKHCPPRPSGPLGRLRTARILEAGMILTIEPGCYFIPKLLDAAKRTQKLAQFFNWDVMDRFRGFGGVRIEDDVLITDKGVENLTFVPRTVAEIEEFMANGANFK
ncbi:xaa-pro dipeptidase [Danaus plexippus plexippus]|uniref:Xaa-Pro dipeptidase n=1 Tax=Danaus plexippus plexippus TaxID=278856 RepID=A0A212FGA3_DANPL|nr:xaa-pro dipeptidase [Danaus plexippus plexippus]